MLTMEGVVQTKVPKAFAEAFAAVHAAFRTPPAEIDEAKVIARANMVAAEDAYYSAADMIRAGWDPLAEQAAAFIARTGFAVDARWPIKSTPNPEIQWPSLDLRRAA
jgi:hypothetical protein